MPLIWNVDDPRFAKQFDGLNHRSQFVHEIARAILPGNGGLEGVWSIANRVYDRHCSPKAGSLNRRSCDAAGRTALSA
jgi:hypothetical protein